MKKRLWRIIIGALLFVPALIIKPSDEWIKPALFAVAYLAVGGDVALRAVKNIVHGRVFDENFLMGLATIGAFCIGKYAEGVLLDLDLWAFVPR